MQVIVSVFRWITGFIMFVGAGLVFLAIIPFENYRFRGASWFCRMVLWGAGVKIKLEGTFPTDRVFVVMANHTTLIDTFILPAITKGRFTGLIAASHTKYPLWGAIVRGFKVIPVYRRDPVAARKSIALAEERLASGLHVVIMPEGTRSLTGKLGPLKKGGFHMAINSKTPILPIGIEGGFEIKAKGSWLLRPGPVHVRIGAPLEPDTYEGRSIEELIDETRQRLMELSGESAGLT